MAADEAYADAPVIGLLLDQFRTRANARADAADLQVGRMDAQRQPSRQRDNHLRRLRITRTSARDAARAVHRVESTCGSTSCMQALGDGSRDTGWKEVLEGLTAAARHAAQPLVEVLLAWRKTGLAQAQQLGSDFGPPSGMVLRKRVRTKAKHRFQLNGRRASHV